MVINIEKLKRGKVGFLNFALVIGKLAGYIRRKRFFEKIKS